MTYLGSTDDFMGNYPPGAAHDPRAPYNQADPPERTFFVRVTYHISRTADVVTTEYDGTEMLQPMQDYEDDYLNPLEIFSFACHCAEYLLTTHNYSLCSKPRLRKIIDSAKDWGIDDKEIDMA